jgi:hypothetical protein
MKYTLTFLLTLALSLASPFVSWGQSISADEAREDLNLLKEAIVKYDHGLPYYALQFSAKADSLLATIKTPLNKFEFFTKASQLCALSNEAHFSLGNWQDSVHAGFLSNQYRYLPISARLVDQRIFIWEDYSRENEMAKLWEIKSINGQGALQIMQNLYGCLPSDGPLLAYQNQKIGPNFNWLYYLYQAQPDTFDLVVQPYLLNQQPSGAPKTLRVAALSRQEMIEVALSREIYNQALEPPPGPDQVFEFYLTDSLNGKRLPTKVALLKLNSFNRQKAEANKIKARKLYKKIFKYLEKEGIKNLAIDLRDNSGGRIEFAHAMVPYLLPEDFESDHPLQTSYLWNGKTKTYKIPKRSRLAFTGNIYVLINGGTYSNASVLARFIKEFTNARLIGSESGSRYHGFTAGSKQLVNLPNSGLRIGIPKAHIRFPIGQQQRQQQRGVLPHNPIYYSAGDYLLNTDLEMEYLNRVLIDLSKQKQVLKSQKNSD